MAKRKPLPTEADPFWPPIEGARYITTTVPTRWRRTTDQAIVDWWLNEPYLIAKYGSAVADQLLYSAKQLVSSPDRYFPDHGHYYHAQELAKEWDFKIKPKPGSL